MASQEGEDEGPKGHGIITSNEDFKDKVKTLTGKIEDKENEIKNMEKIVQLLKSDNEQLNTDNKHNKEKINALNMACEATAKKHMDLANEITILKSDNMELKKQVVQLEKEIKSKDETIEVTRKQSEKLSKELAYRAPSEKKTFEKSKTGWKRQEQKLNGEIQTQLKTIENMTLEYACVKSSVDSLESENAFLKQNVGQLRRDTDYLQEQIRTHQREIRSLGLEKETLLLRLSKVAGANLTYNNPNIADLSDEKRPTKLAEEFSELYDNEWTEAFEKVEGESDEQKTGTLYDLLKLSDEYCTSLSKGHDDAIERAFTTLKYVRALPVIAKGGGEEEQSTNDSPITRQDVDHPSSIMTEDDSDSHTPNTEVTDGQSPTSQKSNGQEPCERQTYEMVDGFVVLESADEGKYEHDTDKIKQDINTNDLESLGQLEYSPSLASETDVRSNAIHVSNISESGQIKESNVTEEKLNDIGTDLDSSRQKETDIDDKNGGTHISNGANMQQLHGERNAVRYDDTLGATKSSKSDNNEVLDETHEAGCEDIGSVKKTKVDQGVPDADTEKIKHAICDSCGSCSISKVDYKFEELSKEQKKMIGDIKKVCEVKQSQDVTQVGARIIAAEMKINTESEEIMAYISKCIDICWSMHRLTPPVYIDFPSYGNDEPFDTKLYRAYTKSGKRLHFVVWPAIHLHEGGPLLAKGVAQGRK